jgi:endonuclease-3
MAPKFSGGPVGRAFRALENHALLFRKTRARRQVEPGRGRSPGFRAAAKRGGAKHVRIPTVPPPAAGPYASSVPRKTAPIVDAAKEPFDIDVVLRRIAQAIEPFKPAAMFALADEGFDSLFEQLVACLISIRTLDEVSLPAAQRLFAVARTPREIGRLSVREIDGLIHPATFHGPKARTIHDLASKVVEEFGGTPPCDAAALQAFRGVGPKCAHLALGIACHQAFISVDIHVHRVTNRWGYVQANTPEKTMLALQGVLPRRHWGEINRLLVPFGKHICTRLDPKCSTCPVLKMCRQVGVNRHR